MPLKKYIIVKYPRKKDSPRNTWEKEVTLFLKASLYAYKLDTPERNLVLNLTRDLINIRNKAGYFKS